MKITVTEKEILGISEKNKKYYLVFFTKLNTFTIMSADMDELCEIIANQYKIGRILINIKNSFNNSIEYIKLYTKLIGG